MAENDQPPDIDLNTLLSYSPEKVLEIVTNQLRRHANSVEGFAVILSKVEFSDSHDYAIQQIERQAKITKFILDVTRQYLLKRGYVDEMYDQDI